MRNELSDFALSSGLCEIVFMSKSELVDESSVYGMSLQFLSSSNNESYSTETCDTFCFEGPKTSRFLRGHRCGELTMFRFARLVMNGLESRFDNWLFALDVSSFDFINGNITRVIEHQAEPLNFFLSFFKFR